MKQWKPDLSPTDVCRSCEMDQEDDYHLWRCLETIEKQKGAWAVAIKNLTVTGQRAHPRAVKKWEAREKQAKEARKRYTAAAPPFKPALDRVVWRELEKVIEGTETVRSDRRHAGTPVEENEGKIWTATELYRGITPLGLSAAIKTAFGTTKEIATYTADKLSKRSRNTARPSEDLE